MALMMIVGAMAIPQATAGLDRSRATVAAKYLMAQVALARSQAVMRSASVAIRFGPADTGYELESFVDGNANGIRSREIQSGIDRRIGAAQRLHEQFPTVAINVRPDAGVDADAVKFGVSSLLVFTPLGSATPGSVYVLGRDGTQFVIRVLGATGRTRLQRYDVNTHTWIDA